MVGAMVGAVIGTMIGTILQYCMIHNPSLSTILSLTDLKNRAQVGALLNRMAELLTSTIGKGAGTKATLAVAHGGGGGIVKLAASAAVVALGATGARGAGVRQASSALVSAQLPHAGGIAAMLRHISKLSLKMVTAMPLDRLLIAVSFTALEELARRDMLRKVWGRIRRGTFDPKHLMPSTPARSIHTLRRPLPAATGLAHDEEQSSAVLPIVFALFALLLLALRMARGSGNAQTVETAKHDVKQAVTQVKKEVVPEEVKEVETSTKTPSRNPKHEEVKNVPSTESVYNAQYNFVRNLRYSREPVDSTPE